MHWTAFAILAMFLLRSLKSIFGFLWSERTTGVSPDIFEFARIVILKMALFAIKFNLTPSTCDS